MGRLAQQPQTSQGAATGNGGGAPAATSLVVAQLRSLEPALARAVPTGMSSTRFSRVVLTEVRKNPALERCRPSTVLGAVMTAAQLGLEFGPLGHAYLVPYKDVCTLIVGYRGYIDLARRSGQLRSIVARAVHDRDEFDYAYGTDEHLHHRPALGDRGSVVAYYGVALLQDGGQVIHVMSPADVEAFRKRSKASSSGPWVTDYDAMACKTVVRRMVPWLPMSVEAAQAIERDEQVISWDGLEASNVDADTGEILDVESSETVDGDPDDPGPPEPPEG